jgi:tetratricopeptide (TPR) repeat protein
LALAHKHGEAVEALEKGWELLSYQVIREQGAGCKGKKVREYTASVSAAVWLGESYRGLGDDGMSRKWWEEACDLAEELRDFDPAMAGYWQGRAFECLGNFKGAVESYRVALSGQLLFPMRGEVKASVKRLKGRLRKGVGD